MFHDLRSLLFFTVNIIDLYIVFLNQLWNHDPSFNGNFVHSPWLIGFFTNIMWIDGVFSALRLWYVIFERLRLSFMVGLCFPVNWVDYVGFFISTYCWLHVCVVHCTKVLVNLDWLPAFLPMLLNEKHVLMVDRHYYDVLGMMTA